MSTSGAPSDDPLAIVCGAGNMPFRVADAVIGRGRRVVLLALTGWADPAQVIRYRHYWARFGQLGYLSRVARQEGCRDIVFIGAVTRPAITQLRFDLRTLMVLPRIIKAFAGGDDHLLTRVSRIVENEGFRLLGPHEVAPEILVPAGQLGRHAPRERDRADIDVGRALLAATGPFDIGQAVVVAGNRVIAIEAAEGTDRMLARIAQLRRDGVLKLPDQSGVLIKAPKPSQDRRFDLPSVGVRTVEVAAAASLAGIAVEACGAVTADLNEMVRQADAAGLFVVGVPADEPNQRDMQRDTRRDTPGHT
jgi:UDP-2,3-diacylglucosamine hydrolase